MLTITEQAAKQIHAAAKEGGMENLALRVAARRKPDGGIDYAMGFDDVQENDTKILAHGIEVVVAATSTELLTDALLDYVEIEPGDFRFIFLNPSDPNFVPPKEDGR
jgi:iron-sulfur cluster assembly protein